MNLPSREIEAQSSGTTSGYGDEITVLKIAELGKELRNGLSDLVETSEEPVYDAGKQAFQTKPFQISPRTIVDYAEVILTDLDGRTVWWYQKTGEPVSDHQYDLETNGRTFVIRDYQYYYDCTISWLYHD